MHQFIPFKLGKQVFQTNFMKVLSLITLLCFISACSVTPDTQPNNEHLTNEIKNTITQQMSAYENQVLGQCESNLAKLSARFDEQASLNEQLLKLTKTIDNKLAKHQTQPHTAKQTCPEPKVIAPKLDGKIIVGELEWVYFPHIDEHFKARVDSGATTSSLSAKHIVEFERDGEDWVRFQLLHQVTDLDGREIEAKIERTVRIRQSTSDETERRHVVKLNVHLGKLHQNAEFTLADRSDMDYPILLGREFLQDLTLIDVGRTFIHPKYKQSEEK